MFKFRSLYWIYFNRTAGIDVECATAATQKAFFIIPSKSFYTFLYFLQMPIKSAIGIVVCDQLLLRLTLTVTTDIISLSINYLFLIYSEPFPIVTEMNLI